MDIQLHYEEYGQGEVLLLLHGNGESGEYFRNQIPYFSKKYRVIAVDTRGHGKSPRGTEPFTIRQFADDLKGFMDEKKIARINELYHKSKAEGLSEAEKAEQAALRQEYVAAIRASLRANLNNISIQEKDGSITDLGKKYGGITDRES